MEQFGTPCEDVRGGLEATLRGRRPRAIAAVSELTNPPKFLMPIADPLPIGSVETHCGLGPRVPDWIPLFCLRAKYLKILFVGPLSVLASSFLWPPRNWGPPDLHLSHPTGNDQLPTHFGPYSFFDLGRDSAGFLGPRRPKRFRERVGAAASVDFFTIRYGLSSALRA